AEDFAGIDAAVNHHLVAFFENVQRNDDVRKQNEIGKGEKGDVHFTQLLSNEQFFVLACLIDCASATSKEKCAEAARKSLCDCSDFARGPHDGILNDFCCLIDAIDHILTHAIEPFDL